MARQLLERAGTLKDGDLEAAAHAEDRLVRTHAMRVLVERAALTPGT